MSTIDTTSLTSGTGLDVTATVDQLIYAERAPERLWQSQQKTLTAQATALRDLNSRLDTLESRINDLKDLSGAFGQYSASSSNNAVFTATAHSTAAIGEHIITVTQLATVASQYSDALASPDATFTPGDLQFKIGNGQVHTISLDQSHSSLRTAVEQINSADLGVTASLLTDASGTRLVLVSNTDGLAGEITIASAPPGLTLHTGTHGQNARLTVDGVPLESSANEVSDILPGITLHLAGDTSGSPTRLSVTSDQSRAKSAINSFVSSYNDMVTKVSAQFQYNATTQTAGTLAGDSTVRGLQSSLLAFAAFRYESGGDITSLRSLGIKMQDDGTLQVDETVLSAALSNNIAGVQAFFQGTANDGFASTLSTQLATLTDSVNGPLLVDAKSMDTSVKAFGQQIDDFEVRMEARYKILIEQYTRVDTLLRQMPLLEQQIQAQLGSLS